MPDVNKNFVGLTAAVNPYLPSDCIKPTGSIDAKIELTAGTGRYVSTGATNAIILLNSIPSPPGNVISANFLCGDFTSDATASRGGAIMAADGDGYFFIIRSTDLRVYYTTIGGGANTLNLINTVAITGADTDDWFYSYDKTTGLFLIQQNGVTRHSAINTVHLAKASQFLLGICSRSPLGKIRSFTAHDINVYAVTSINAGNPITEDQTSVSSVLSGFTVLPTITTNAAGLTASSVTGTANAPTFVKSRRVDGGQYPRAGTSVTFTFTNGSQVASGNQVVNKNANETEIVFNAPNVANPRYLGGAIFAATGRTIATNDVGEYVIPPGMAESSPGAGDGLIIYSDGRMTYANPGEFYIWIRSDSNGVNYLYKVILSAGGGVVVVSLTSMPITSAAISSTAITSVAL